MVDLPLWKTAPRKTNMFSILQVREIVGRYVNRWNADSSRSPLWVVLASPGDSVQIPGITFGKVGDAKAGMEIPLNAHLIVLNKAMRPESLLTTFFHELGHAEYRLANKGRFSDIDSEASAILFSLGTLAKENLEDLAVQEAKAVCEMGASEPYKSAIAIIDKDRTWQRYSRL
jgi:hypothetical protein